ncbi:hypothetical protein RFZ44_00040, partial [Acinetobacter sp. 163]|nr:hypothetical protein [Acinetobacter sp. 163]
RRPILSAKGARKIEPAAIPKRPELSNISTAVSELEAATKENDVDAIKAKTEALQNILMPITQRAYE